MESPLVLQHSCSKTTSCSHKGYLQVMQISSNTTSCSHNGYLQDMQIMQPAAITVTCKELHNPWPKVSTPWRLRSNACNNAESVGSWPCIARAEMLRAMQGVAGGAGSKCAVIYEIVHDQCKTVMESLLQHTAFMVFTLNVLLFHIAANYANFQCTIMHMYNILIVFVAHICRIWCFKLLAPSQVKSMHYLHVLSLAFTSVHSLTEVAQHSLHPCKPLCNDFSIFLIPLQWLLC